MSVMINDIDKAVENYYNKHGRDPKYLVLNPKGYQQLQEELGEIEGLSSQEMYFRDTTEYDNMIICVTHKMDSPIFDIA